MRLPNRQCKELDPLYFWVHSYDSILPAKSITDLSRPILFTYSDFVSLLFGSIHNHVTRKANKYVQCQFLFTQQSGYSARFSSEVWGSTPTTRMYPNAHKQHLVDNNTFPRLGGGVKDQNRYSPFSPLSLFLSSPSLEILTL